MYFQLCTPNVQLLWYIVGCENKAGDDKCYADASVGECKDNPDFMNENCAMACGKCKCTVVLFKVSVRF